MADLRWFLLELDLTGKVISCTPVDQAKQNGRSWIYVQARDEKSAQRAAMNSYMRDVQRKRRAELDLAGKCRWCGRKADRGPKRCSICLAKDSTYSKRYQAKQRGDVVAPLDRKVAVADRRTAERREVIADAAPGLRLAILVEVQEAWAASATNGAFTSWLTRQIEAAGGKRRAG